MKKWFVSAVSVLLGIWLISCNKDDSSQPSLTPEEIIENRAKDSLRSWIGKSLGFHLKTAPVRVTYTDYDAQKEPPGQVLRGKELFTYERIEKMKATIPNFKSQADTKPLMTLELLYPNLRSYDSPVAADAAYFSVKPASDGTKKGTVTIRYFYSYFSGAQTAERNLWEAVVDVP